MKAMDAIPYEENSFYIFDRGYNNFKRLHTIENIGAYFVVRGKKNNDFKQERWKQRFPKDSGILSDVIGHMDRTLTGKNTPTKSAGWSIGTQNLKEGSCSSPTFWISVQ